MTGVEITLILVGIIFVLVSFFVQEKLTPKDVQEITRLSEKELKIIVERELKNANDKVEDAIDAVVEQSQENAKRLMEKETNEKIMAINEYSNTVIESMNKTHNEILFLYNMLNDKHTELTGLASQLQQFSEQVKHTQDEMMTHLTETRKPSPSVQPEWNRHCRSVFEHHRTNWSDALLPLLPAIRIQKSPVPVKVWQWPVRLLRYFRFHRQLMLSIIYFV